MEKQYIEIAKDFSCEIRKQYPEIDITSIRFVAITEQGIDVSALPYNLEEAHYAMVVCNFDYPLHNGYHSNFFILFIDDKGKASNKLKVGDWTISFDEPVTGGHRSPSRHCFFKKEDLCLDINCTDCDICQSLPTLWKLFLNIRNCSDMEIRTKVKPYSVGSTTYLYKLIREG
ncbi:MAG: hypothetical protein IJ845_03685 [Bacteroidaceae bacterium]|nr:hypothetical protein [Bacteroidaceae bacterium]